MKNYLQPNDTVNVNDADGNRLDMTLTWDGNEFSNIPVPEGAVLLFNHPEFPFGIFEIMYDDNYRPYWDYQIQICYKL